MNEKLPPNLLDLVLDGVNNLPVTVKLAEFAFGLVLAIVGDEPAVVVGIILFVHSMAAPVINAVRTNPR